MLLTDGEVDLAQLKRVLILILDAHFDEFDCIPQTDRLLFMGNFTKVRTCVQIRLSVVRIGRNRHLILVQWHVRFSNNWSCLAAHSRERNSSLLPRNGGLVHLSDNVTKVDTSLLLGHLVSIVVFYKRV